MVVGLSGEGEVLIDDVVYTLRAGERLLVPRYHHTATDVLRTAPLNCLFVGFELMLSRICSSWRELLDVFE